MFSPFLLRHLTVFVLVAANLVLSIWMVSQAKQSFATASLPASITRRAASLAYLTVSVFAFLFAAALFLELEFSDDAAQCWKNTRNWTRIQPGLTPAEVKQILGEPKEVRFERIYLYDLHPITMLDYGFIDFEDGKVKTRSPLQADGLPPGFEIGMRDRLTSMLMILSLLGLCLLAVASLLPLGMSGGWASLPVYYPLIALLCVIAYERTQIGGWRFDLFLLMPVYAILALTWAFRIYKLVRSSA